MSEPYVTIMREIKSDPNSLALLVVASWCGKTADELERLQARVEQLEGALREIANAANYTAPEDIEARLHNEVKVYAIARAALKGGDDE